jgi:hypothetical protein
LRGKLKSSLLLFPTIRAPSYTLFVWWFWWPN